jgi:hypothetical protein
MGRSPSFYISGDGDGDGEDDLHVVQLEERNRKKTGHCHFS